MPNCPLCKTIWPDTCALRLYNSENECPICLEKNDFMYALPCGHQFCKYDLKRLHFRPDSNSAAIVASHSESKSCNTYSRFKTHTLKWFHKKAANCTAIDSSNSKTNTKKKCCQTAQMWLVRPPGSYTEKVQETQKAVRVHSYSPL